jgi:hypothetical protein
MMVVRIKQKTNFSFNSFAKSNSRSGWQAFPKIDKEQKGGAGGGLEDGSRS